MTWRRAAERARSEILSASYEGGLDSVALRRRVLAALGRAVPVDAAFFATCDPATLLYTSAVRHGMPPDVTPLFLHNEFLQEDVNKFRTLAQAPAPVNWLDRATEGNRAASPRCREIMQPIGLGDELRAALRTGETCWGFMCLHREDRSSGFSAEEARLLTGLVPHIGEGLRRTVLAERAQFNLDADGPGVAVVAEDGSILAATPAASRWLAELAQVDQPQTLGLPIAVRAVMQRLAQTSEAQARPGLMPRVRVRAPSGGWLVIHASRLTSSIEPARTQTSLVIEPATPTDLAPLIVAVYGFTRRESAVLQRLLQGLPAKRIAAELEISLHTVRDHIKAIFNKAGVGSRGELIAEIYHSSSRW